LERLAYDVRWLTHNPCPHPTDPRTTWVMAGVMMFVLGMAALRWFLTRDVGSD
jgi:hypothetical protein